MPDDRRIRSFLQGLATGLHFVLISLFASSPAQALDPLKALTQYIHDVWQTNEGLPQNSVYAAVQTRDGYLWLATQEGLVRFDGVRFTVFDSRNTPGLGSAFILSLLEDRKGRLWIGTSDGVVCREGGVFTRFTSEDGVPQGQVKSLLEDRDGRLWVGTLGGGIARLSGGRFVRPEGADSLSARRVQALVEDRSGVLWIGTEAGLGRLDAGSFRLVSRRDGLSHDDVNALYEDRQGALWIGTTGGGLNRMKDGRITAFTTREGLSNDSINAIMEDRDGNLWVGARGGVNRLRNGRFSAFTTLNGLSSEFVFSLTEDREGSLWIGTGGGGLNRLRDGRFTPVGPSEGLTSGFVRSFYEGAGGVIWIGTDGGGVNRLKDGRLTAITKRQGLSNDFVEAVFEDSQKALWVGTSGGGLNRLKDGRIDVFSKKHGLANDYVTSIQEDANGALWVGTRGGLSRLKDGRIASFTTRDGLSNDIVRAVCVARNGAVWIGTEGGGLNRLENGRITRLTGADGVSSRNIVSIREDRDATLWIGSRGGGLMRWRDGRVASVGTKQGLDDDTVLAAQEDDAGRLWMTSNKGIFRAAKSEIHDVMDGRRERLTSIAFGTADGMRSAEGNGSSSSGMRSLDGKLWFGTIAGAVFMDPARFKTNPVAPSVHVEEVRLEGRLVSRGSMTSLPSGTSALEIHYTATSLAAPSGVTFRYRLEGYDPGWIDAGSRRTAYYTGLPHGQYRFHVVASNEDGIANETGDSIGFSVAPRFHETPGFRVGALLLLGAGLYGAHRLRVVQLSARERELVAVVEERTHNLKVEKERTEAALRDAQLARAEAESANRAKSAFLATMSHELRTPLNAVLGFTQLMGRHPARDASDREHLDIIGRSGEHLLGLINDVLSLSKIEAGSVPVSLVSFDPVPMLRGLIQMLDARARTRGVELILEGVTGFPETVVGDEGKLRQILINLLSNAVKFTERGRIALEAEWNEGEARFSIADSGPGMSPEEVSSLFRPFVQTESGRRAGEGTGLGLAISRSFARLLGGDIEVSSRLGQGTTFLVRLPMPRADASAGAQGREDRRRVRGFETEEGSRRVLVVDDVRENRLLLSRQMSAVGFEVGEAEDGARAIEFWRSKQPDLILMDVRMPVMDGLAATRAIRAAERADESTRPVRIIALSASVLDDEGGEVRDAGCDDLLLKPFREGALYEKVAHLLGLRIVFEESTTDPPAGEGVGPEASMNPDRVARLAASLRNDLREAVMVGDDQGAARAIEAIRNEDPDLAKGLTLVLRQYQFDRLLRIVDGGADER